MYWYVIVLFVVVYERLTCVDRDNKYAGYKLRMRDWCPLSSYAGDKVLGVMEWYPWHKANQTHRIVYYTLARGKRGLATHCV